jgi:choline dehydrogenase-like flavoprotein
MQEDTAHLVRGHWTALWMATAAAGRLRNLWICDGSLFPTGGGANPSLTIIALACRIGGAARRAPVVRALHFVNEHQNCRLTA